MEKQTQVELLLFPVKFRNITREKLFPSSWTQNFAESLENIDQYFLTAFSLRSKNESSSKVRDEIDFSPLFFVIYFSPPLPGCYLSLIRTNTPTIVNHYVTIMKIVLRIFCWDRLFGLICLLLFLIELFCFPPGLGVACQFVCYQDY